MTSLRPPLASHLHQPLPRAKLTLHPCCNSGPETRTRHKDHMPPLRLILPFCLALGACAPWPDPVIPGGAEAARLPWPELVPVARILAGATVGEAPAGPPRTRIAALNARATALRGPIIPSATRGRMARGVNLRGL